MPDKKDGPSIDITNPKGEVITKKPDIDDKKSLTVDEILEIESSLKAKPVFEGESQDFLNYTDYAEKDTDPIIIDGKKVVGYTAKCNLIHRELKPKKNDYQNDFKRGTVDYNERCASYCFHTVVIPDGTVINDRNFAQAAPDTPAIIGENLVFNDCNLCNVLINPSWVLNSCLVIKRKETITAEDDSKDLKSITVRTEVMGRDDVDYVQIEERSYEVREDQFHSIKLKVAVQDGIK